MAMVVMVLMAMPMHLRDQPALAAGVRAVTVAVGLYEGEGPDADGVGDLARPGVDDDVAVV